MHRTVSAHPASASGGHNREARWRRLWLSAVVMVTYLVTEILLKVVVIVQLLLVMWSGSPSAWLCRRGEELALQIHGMWLYLSCVAPDAPWPFAPWPRSFCPEGKS
jgi:hypothetical protein